MAKQSESICDAKRVFSETQKRLNLFLSFEAQSEMEAELAEEGDCNDLPTHCQKYEETNQRSGIKSKGSCIKKDLLSVI